MSKIRIGIDMRMAGEGFGIGEYASHLAQALIERNRDFQYVLIFDRQFNQALADKFSKNGTEIVLTNCKYYSFQEQVRLPRLLWKLRLDLVHFPNFNLPFAYRGKYVVTIHDLIHHQVPGKRKKNWPYRLAYRAIIANAARSAKKIIAVSHATKNDIISILGTPENRIDVVYEGVTSSMYRRPDAETIDELCRRLGIDGPFFLSVGVWRRYKNYPRLTRAFNRFISNGSKAFQLVLTGDPDSNYPEVMSEVRRSLPTHALITPGKVSRQDLTGLYYSAFAYVHPSLFEGFGLPLIEAQTAGCPVAASDIPAAREIMKESAIFFDPLSENSITEAMDRIANDQDLRVKLKQDGDLNAKRFSWSKAAQETEIIYRSILN